MGFREFVDSRRTKATRETYASVGRLLVRDPDALAGRAREDERGAEDELIAAILAKRESDDRWKLAPTSISASLHVLKSFFDDEEILFNWKRVRARAPAASSVARDRAPTTQELRSLLQIAPLRERAAVLLMGAGGMRVGALPGLRLGDLEFLDDGITRVKVYAGTDDGYLAYITPEATEAVRAYLDARRRVGRSSAPHCVFLKVCRGHCLRLLGPAPVLV